MDKNETDRLYRARIERACQAQGLDIKGWEIDTDYDDARPQADLGRVRVTADDEDHGLFAGTEGVLKASVVGAMEYGNERVAFHYLEDETDSPNEVPDLLALELI